MKYIKLFEDKERDELRELIHEIEELELCQDLKDHGFSIVIGCTSEKLIKFPNDISKIKFKDINEYQGKYVNYLSIVICKLYKIFYIDDSIINNLLFIESYTEGELGLKVNSYQGDSSKDGKYASYYYKSIKDLPKDKEVSSICINFIKA